MSDEVMFVLVLGFVLGVYYAGSEIVDWFIKQF